MYEIVGLMIDAVGLVTNNEVVFLRAKKQKKQWHLEGIAEIRWDRLSNTKQQSSVLPWTGAVMRVCVGDEIECVCVCPP